MALSGRVSGSSDLIFAPEDPVEKNRGGFSDAWKILIIDDEPAIHEVTRYSLKDFEFAGRGVEFLNAYSAEQARKILLETPDIAVALVDVVMEYEHAGLDLVRFIREELNNQMIRLVLRTGQPGQAPEKKVIREYDINDYKEKTELTSQKLYSTIYTSLRSYRDLVALNDNRRGLEHIIHATAELFVTPNINDFIQGVLQQLVALLYLGEDSVYINCDCLAMEEDKGESRVIAATGRFAQSLGKNPAELLDEHIHELLNEARINKSSIVRGKEFVGYFQPRDGREGVIYICSDQPLTKSDLKLVDLFLHNVSIAYENALLNDEIEGTQREMVYLLGESIETRSSETGQHVRRVAEYCRLIALGLGLSEREAEVIQTASPLHDFGKIGIPDRILHKPGKLDPEEWEIMKTHTTIGYDLLNHSEREILKAAALIAGQHHEHWNGNGYPEGLKGEDIHIYARIAAVADVYDALGSKRCYKDVWPQEEIVKLLTEQRGRQFDPTIIDWVLANLDTMQDVRRRYPD